MTVYAMTGASGYIAGRVIELLGTLDGCEKIIGLDIKPPERDFSKLDFRISDVRDPEIGETFKKNNVDVVLHFAFVLNPIHNLDLMHDININGTRNVLESSLAAGVKHVLVTSSASAYGALPDNPVPIKEDHPIRAREGFPYSTDKKEMDMLCQEFAARHPEMKITIFRPCIVIGPGFENFISRAMMLFFNFKVGGENPPFQFVHEDDVARAVMLAVEKGKAGIFNIAGEGMITLDEIWEMKKRLLTINFPAWIIYPLVWLAWRLHLPGIEYPHRTVDFFRYPWVVDITKAKEELGFIPEHSSRDIWKNYLDYRESNPRSMLDVWRKKRREKQAYKKAESKT